MKNETNRGILAETKTLEKEITKGQKNWKPYCTQNISKGQNDPLIIGSTSDRLAEEYNVSPKTIKRNSRLATGLTSIGEVNPDTKTTKNKIMT